MYGLNGKIAIVTGAGHGIGESTARLLFEEGAKVVLIDTSMEKMQEIVNVWDANCFRTMALTCNLSNKREIKRTIEKVINKYDRIDILVNNLEMNEALCNEMTVEGWNKVLETSLSGIFHMTREVIPYMRKQKYGKIVHLTFSPNHKIGEACYAASKKGVRCITRTLSKELGKYNITVNAVLPGIISTDDKKNNQLKETLGKNENNIPLGRAGNPEEVARAICFLVSDNADFISGVELDVTGGWLIE